MRKLVSKQERERQEKRKQTIIGIFMLSILILSTLGYSLQSGTGGDKTIVYNGFEFVYKNGFWTIGSFAFKYNPEEVSNIDSVLDDASFYEGLPLYLYSENTDAEAEIRVNLGQIAESVNDACPEKTGVPGANCGEEIPVISCNSSSDNFIILRKSENQDIRQKNNCVYIEGPEQELAMLADQFLYKILGIK